MSDDAASAAEVPSHLVSSARLLQQGRLEEAAAELDGGGDDDHWFAAEAGLGALIMRAAGARKRDFLPLLDACVARTDQHLAAAALLIEERTPIALASARVLSDVLIATMGLLGADFNDGQALARNLRATALHYEGRGAEALDELREAIALRPGDGADFDVWATLPVNAAAIAGEMGLYEQASRFVAMGMSHIDRLDDPRRIHALLRAASDVDQSQGRYLDARKKMEAAVAFLATAGPSAGADLARACASLANVERELGDAGKSARYAREALEAWPSGGTPLPYSLLAASANAEWAVAGDWGLYRGRARALASAAAREGSASVVDVWANLALACADRGRHRAAERLFDKVVGSADADSAGSTVRRIDARRRHALSLLELDEIDAASVRLREAEGLVEGAGPALGIYRHVLARDQGRLAERRGDIEGAFAAYERAVLEEAENVGRRLGSALSIGETFGHRDVVDAVAPLLRLASRDPTPDRLTRAHRAILLSRDGATRAVRSHRSGLPDGVRATLRAWSEARRLAEWGSRLAEAGRAPRDLPRIATELIRLEAALSLAPRETAVSARERSSGRALRGDEAAVDFVVAIEALPEGRDVRIHAFVSQGGGSAPELLEWRDASGILLRLDDLRRALAVSRDRDGVGPEPPGEIAALSEVLWRPIEARIRPTIRHLLVRPDGNLGQLPFAALQGSDGRLVCERLTVLLERTQPAREPDDTASGYLVVGDPSPLLGWRDRLSVISAAVRRSAPTVIPTSRLRSAAVEARAVAGMLDASGFRGRCLVGRQASRDAVVGGLRARIVHLACHGFSLPRSDSPCPREAAVLGHPDHDWRTGLVLAGTAGWLARSGELRSDRDGLLLARDVSLLDLRGVRLVVLAACETGFGEPALGEGSIAMADAFVVAGAAAVLAAAWVLDDAETAAFMQDFYAAFLSGVTAEEALRSVQDAWRRAGKASRLWAGYSVLGRSVRGPSRLEASAGSGDGLDGLAFG